MANPTKEQLQKEQNKRIAHWKEQTQKFPFLTSMLTVAQKLMIWGSDTSTAASEPDDENEPSIQTVEFFCEFRPVESIKVFENNNLFYQFPKEEIIKNSENEPIGSNNFAPIQLTLTNNANSIKRTDGRLFEKAKEYFVQYKFYEQNGKLSSRNTTKFIFDGSRSITFVFSSKKEQGIDENLNKLLIDTQAKLAAATKKWSEIYLKCISGVFNYFNRALTYKAFSDHVEPEDIGFYEDADFKGLAFATNQSLAWFIDAGKELGTFLGKAILLRTNVAGFITLGVMDIAIGKFVDYAEDELTDMRKQAAKDANEMRFAMHKAALSVLEKISEHSHSIFSDQMVDFAIKVGKVTDLNDAQKLLSFLEGVIKDAPNKLVAEQIAKNPFGRYLLALNSTADLQKLNKSVIQELFPQVSKAWAVQMAGLGLAYECLPLAIRDIIKKADAGTNKEERTALLLSIPESGAINLSVQLSNDALILNKTMLLKCLGLQNAVANKDDEKLDNVVKYAIENNANVALLLKDVRVKGTGAKGIPLDYYDVNIASFVAEINFTPINILKTWKREVSIF